MELIKNNSPFIHLMKSHNKYYLYSVNRNEVLQIDSETYNYIKIMTSIGKLAFYEKYNHNNCDTFASIIKLDNSGYLRLERPLIIEHPAFRYCESYLEGYINSLTLQVTQNCNLKCNYCPYSGEGILDRKHNKNNMTYATAKKAIDFFKEKSRYNDSVNISFYGGEPLIEYKLIRKCIEYCNSVLYDKNITYNITSNGTIMNSDILSMLSENNVILTISLDGPTKIHNANRRYATNGNGSYDDVYQTLAFIKSTFPEYYKKIQFNAVIEKDLNLNSLNDIQSYFTSDELVRDNKKNFALASDTRTSLSYAQSNEFRIKRNSVLFSNIMNIASNHQNLNDFNLYDIKGLRVFKNNLLCDKSELKSKCHHNGPCMPGYTRMIVDIYGNIRPCERVSETSACMIIGNIDDGFNYSQVRRLLNIGEITQETCKKCWAIRLCKICAEKADALENLSPKLKLERCRTQRKLIEDYLIQCYLLSKMNVEI